MYVYLTMCNFASGVEYKYRVKRVQISHADISTPQERYNRLRSTPLDQANDS